MEKVILDEVRVEPHDGEDPEEKKRREARKAGCAVIVFGLGFLVFLAIATPFVIGLYRWALG